jgi:hypothetical protein
MMRRGSQCAFGSCVLVVVLAFSPKAVAQIATAPGYTAATAGTSCNTSTQAFAWPDANGYTLSCVGGTWQSVSAATGAAGSTGQVQYNGGSGALAGSGNLIWSNTTSSLGIGTASPQSALQVYGGELQVGSSGGSCAAANAGALRYAATQLLVCNGSAWRAVQ